MVYAWRKDSFQTGDAQAAGEMCQRLESEGRLTAENLVEENRPEDAPLHDSFEWDDSIAGQEWRKQQARNIIKAIVTVREDQKPQRAYFSITRASPEYESVNAILQNEDKYEKLKKLAFSELVSFQSRYQEIVELSPVFDAIDEVLSGVM